MPREVIMPALGMAQETGQIVAWLKRPGDAVKAGEPLMEVETDKATMEVEAAADGFLTDVRAAEGASVPIGEVVAMISETGDGGGAAPPVPDAEPPKTATATAADGREVIMPALGMAQDIGKIIAWAKAPGDRVAADDVLLEIETDKATIEVQAGHDGWLAETRAADGDEVPVGEVIAIISEAEPAQPRQRGRSQSAAKAAEAPSDAEQAVAPRPEPAARPAAEKTQGGAPPGRILASPKARRLAAERGLDLARLAAAGHAPPFHVADLEDLAAMSGSPSTGTAPGTSGAQITAEVPAASLVGFCGWATERGQRVTPGRAVAAFAAAALRPANGAARPVHISLTAPGRSGTTLADPDLLPWDDHADAAPDLVLRDLTSSRLTTLSLATPRVATLTLAHFGETCRLTLDFDTGTLAPEAATALVQTVAERIEEPLRHLL